MSSSKLSPWETFACKLGRCSRLIVRKVFEDNKGADLKVDLSVDVLFLDAAVTRLSMSS